MGKGRTTTGMILACLIKDILFGDSEKIYYKDSDLVDPKDYSDEDEVAEEVMMRWSVRVRSYMTSQSWRKGVYDFVTIVLKHFIFIKSATMCQGGVKKCLAWFINNPWWINDSALGEGGEFVKTSILIAL